MQFYLHSPIRLHCVNRQLYTQSRYSSVEFGLDYWAILVRLPYRGKIFFACLKCLDRLWDSPSSFQKVLWPLFPAIKRPWREADLYPQSTAEVKNEWSYTFTPPIPLHGVHTDSFITFLKRSHSAIIYMEYPANQNTQKHRAMGQGDRTSDRQKAYPSMSGLTDERLVLVCTMQAVPLFFGI
jgi:hypothetical protein